jgi:hypothetical protein
MTHAQEQRRNAIKNGEESMSPITEPKIIGRPTFGITKREFFTIEIAKVLISKLSVIEMEEYRDDINTEMVEIAIDCSLSIAEDILMSLEVNK